MVKALPLSALISPASPHPSAALMAAGNVRANKSWLRWDYTLLGFTAYVLPVLNSLAFGSVIGSHSKDFPAASG